MKHYQSVALPTDLTKGQKSGLDALDLAYPSNEEVLERRISDPALVIESTSDDTVSSEEINPQMASNDEDILIAEKCRPMTSTMRGLKQDSTQKFVFDVCAGLSGEETQCQFPCIFDEASRRFFVWLGDTDISYFTKSTFMNLCDFAEDAGATSVVFLIFRQHRQKAQYRNMFSVIDARGMPHEAVQELIGAADREAVKSVLASTKFYELEL